MKKLIAGILTGAMLCSGAAMAADQSATTGDTLTVTLDNIQETMLKYSPQMMKVKNDLDTAKGSYYDLLDDMDDIQDKISATDNFTVGITLTQQYDSLEDTRDKLKCALDVAQAQYNQKVQQQVLKAQQQYITYFIDAYQETNGIAELTQQQQDLNLAKEKLSRGYLSQTAYTAIVTALSDKQNGISASTSKREADLRDLRILLGVPKTASVKLETPAMGKVDFTTLLALDYDKDLAELLANSADIKAKQISYDSRFKGDYAKDWEIEAARIDLQQTKDSVAESFRKQYDGLMNSYDTLKTSWVKLTDKKRDMAQEQQKLQKGFSSSKNLSDMKLDLQNMQSKVATEENRLYCAYLIYVQTKNGN